MLYVLILWRILTVENNNYGDKMIALYVQEEVTQPKILNRTILSNYSSELKLFCSVSE